MKVMMKNIVYRNIGVLLSMAMLCGCAAQGKSGDIGSDAGTSASSTLASSTEVSVSLLSEDVDEDNHYHSYNITDMGAEHDGDSIVLYYKDDINLAQPRVGEATWIRTYAIFGVALILLSIRLIVIYRSDHNVYADGSLSIDEIQVPDDTSVGIMSRR